MDSKELRILQRTQTGRCMGPLREGIADSMFPCWVCLLCQAVEGVRQRQGRPSASQVRQVTSQRACPEVHHSKDSSIVGSLDDGVAELATQVCRQHVVQGQLQQHTHVCYMKPHK